MRVESLFYNGNILVSPFSMSDAHWFSVDQGRISFMGRGDPPRSFSAGHHIDLQGKRVVPGFIDAHVHLVNLGLRVEEIDCSHCQNERELIHFLSRVKFKDDWLIAYGLNVDHWHEPERLNASLLDRVSTRFPILIRRQDEHAIWVNSLVLQIAKVSIEDCGHPRGYLVDEGMLRVLRFQPSPTEKGIVGALRQAQQEFLKYGVTSVHDMSSERVHIECLSDLFRHHQYQLRVNSALYGDETRDMFSVPQSHMYDSSLSIRSKKIFIDGALGSYGAWLSKPYNDRPSTSGHVIWEKDMIINEIRSALQKRFQLIFHTLGDQSSRWVLEILSKNFNPERIVNQRFRFEHLQVFDSKSLDLMNKFGIIASIQPWHALSDSLWVRKRVGVDRLSQVGKIKSFMDSSLIVCGGSDAPIEPWNPLWGIYAAVTRKPIDGNKVPRSWLLDQKISIREALALYTVNAAYAEFSENIKGTLEVGKLADFVVLSDDILNLHPRDFLDVKVLLTVIGGKIVYEG